MSGNASDDRENASFLSESYRTDSREELTEVYDNWAQSYDRHAERRNSAQPGAVAQACIDFINDRDTHILDVGAGTGLIGEKLHQAGFAHVDALDPSGEMLRVAKAKGVYTNYHQLYLGDALPFETHHFGGVVASGIFTTGHVEASVFPEINRILQPGGAMIFALNAKMLDEIGFRTVLEDSASLNWSVHHVSAEFDMMDSAYSTAKAVVVTLQKLAR